MPHSSLPSKQFQLTKKPLSINSMVGLRFMLSHPASFIALGFGAGLIRYAPGTAGTAFAWLLWLLLNKYFYIHLAILFFIVSFFIGVWACSLCSKKLSIVDPQCIVLDEMLAFWIVLSIISPAHFVEQCAVFALFRYFDIAKPEPIGFVDRYFKTSGRYSGFGILCDDLIAAGFSIFIFALWVFFFGKI